MHETSGRDEKVRDRDETLVRLETVSRPRRRDRDHIPVKLCNRKFMFLRVVSVSEYEILITPMSFDNVI